MFSVKKQELFQNGLIGTTCIIISVLNWFTNKDILACILLALVIAIYVITAIYQKRTKVEPWDELTRDNYAKARKLTLFYIEFTLLIWAILCIIGHLQVPIKASHILFYYGSIKLFQTATFIYFDTHVVD